MSAPKDKVELAVNPVTGQLDLVMKANPDRTMIKRTVDYAILVHSGFTLLQRQTVVVPGGSITLEADAEIIFL
jgi:hypothetical protein